MKRFFQVLTVIVVGIALILTLVESTYSNVDGRWTKNTPRPTITPAITEIVGIVIEAPIRHNSVALVRIEVESVKFSPIVIDQPIFIYLDVLALQLKVGDRIKFYCGSEWLDNRPIEFSNCEWDKVLVGD